MAYQYPILLALTVQRLWELYISRKRIAEEVGQGKATLIAEPGFPALVAVHAAWYAGCWFEVVYRQPTFRSAVVIPMLVVWGLALALRVWIMAAMGRNWNVRLIAREEQEVVSRGPYRFIRHPNYLAVILEVAAIPLLLGAYATALAGSLANGVALWFRIRREEAYLAGVEGYEAAFAGKKRLVPGLF